MESEGFAPARTAVLVGTGSRSGADWLSRQPPERRAMFHSFGRVSGGRWAEAIADALEDGVECIAVAGGDGTLRRAAGAVADSGAVLGIIPTGTGNAVAHEMGISVDPDEALTALMFPGEVRPVDIGLCDGEPFVNVMTMGLTSVIARELKGLPKDRMGRWAYLPAVIGAYQKAKTFAVRVEAGAANFDGRALQVVVAVTRNHGGPFPTTPQASHDDGLLSVYVATAESRGQILLYASALVLGHHTSLPNVWSTDAAEVLIKPSIPRAFVLDGDRFNFAEARAMVRHQALKVFVPGGQAQATGELLEVGG